MIDAIAAHDIDIVLVLSPWPETFAYVTYEAFAAGADVIALADSGNVAAAIIKNNMGLVVRDEETLISLFDSLRTVAYVRARRGRSTHGWFSFAYGNDRDVSGGGRIRGRRWRDP